MSDPLGGSVKYPSISWKGKAIGATLTGKVFKAPEIVQQRDYETRELEFWQDGQPKNTIVIGIEVNGEKRNLWASIPSALQKALIEARDAAGDGVQIEEGGELTITFTDEKPIPGKEHLNPQKIFSAKYVPGVKPAADPLGGGAAAPAADEPW
jgi:hypothetical protein